MSLKDKITQSKCKMMEIAKAKLEDYKQQKKEKKDSGTFFEVRRKTKWDY